MDHKRKAYSKILDIPPDILFKLNTGLEPTLTLTEQLSIDMSILWHNVIIENSSHLINTIDYDHYSFNKELAKLGVVARMKLCAQQIFISHKNKNSNSPYEFFIYLSQHKSDTVRGWACYLVPYLSSNIANSLRLINELAADNHFAVREWAWLALRGQIISELDESIKILTTWSLNENCFIRRYASESTRPRGVWCAHINEFKFNLHSINKILPLLNNLQKDTNKYVQNSVANWLNDCYKNHADFTQNLCNNWLINNPDNICTQYIVKRALRNKFL